MNDNKAEAAYHPYSSAAEALAAAQQARAEREAREHQAWVNGIMQAIAKRVALS